MWARQGGYFFLLSVIPFDLDDLKDQSNDANDQNAGLNQIGKCNHGQVLLSYAVRRTKKRP